MGFGQAISSGFSNLTNFSGRASRSEFWWWMLFVWIVNIIVGTILNIAIPNDGTNSMGFADFTDDPQRDRVSGASMFHQLAKQAT